ncbi:MULTISPECIES: hypothetical protein [Mammaliicoccus]|uniref:Uncharacterized protein n=2 Tax=Mammaliicoccus sciuri TaxID=1296 RepID=A0A7T4PUR1_MAMSC|nr:MULTISPECIES: hypothetical protein [Mammaliicoccus]EZX23015.1 hypothetical protein V070_01143 [Staphylococcus aureus C0673]MBF9298168.1 hypothetical protein [Staphylococcus schleiferi]MCD8836020.1 hypothetical protein [Mammaliicoccus sciuri]MCJ0913423.1 hypothetical protein [Mammaliicoccus sciuri]MCJ0939003.1 hypothetical protein [Mammaliicoccus sciuri]
MIEQKDNNLSVGIFAGILPICIIIYAQFIHALLYSNSMILKSFVVVILFILTTGIVISISSFISQIKKQLK